MAELRISPASLTDVYATQWSSGAAVGSGEPGGHSIGADAGCTASRSAMSRPFDAVEMEQFAKALGLNSDDRALLAFAGPTGLRAVKQLMSAVDELEEACPRRLRVAGVAGSTFALEICRVGHLPQERTSWVAFDCATTGPIGDATAANLIAVMIMNTFGHSAMVTDPHGKYKLRHKHCNPCFSIRLLIDSPAMAASAAPSDPVPAAAVAQARASEAASSGSRCGSSRVSSRRADAEAAATLTALSDGNSVSGSDESSPGDNPSSPAPRPSAVGLGVASRDDRLDLQALLGFGRNDSGHGAAGSPAATPAHSPSQTRESSSSSSSSSSITAPSDAVADQQASGTGALTRATRASRAKRARDDSELDDEPTPAAEHPRHEPPSCETSEAWTCVPIAQRAPDPALVSVYAAHGRALLGMSAKTTTTTTITTTTVVTGLDGTSQTSQVTHTIAAPRPPVPTLEPARLVQLRPLEAEALRGVLGSLVADVQPNLVTATLDHSLSSLETGFYRGPTVATNSGHFWAVMRRLAAVLSQPSARGNLASQAISRVLHRPRPTGPCSLGAANEAVAFAIGFVHTLLSADAANSPDAHAVEVRGSFGLGGIGGKAQTARAGLSATVALILPLRTNMAMVGALSDEQYTSMAAWAARRSRCVSGEGRWITGSATGFGSPAYQVSPRGPDSAPLVRGPVLTASRAPSPARASWQGVAAGCSAGGTAPAVAVQQALGGQLVSVPSAPQWPGQTVFVVPAGAAGAAAEASRVARHSMAAAGGDPASGGALSHPSASPSAFAQAAHPTGPSSGPGTETAAEAIHASAAKRSRPSVASS